MEFIEVMLIGLLVVGVAFFSASRCLRNRLMTCRMATLLSLDFTAEDTTASAPDYIGDQFNL